MCPLKFSKVETTTFLFCFLVGKFGFVFKSRCVIAKKNVLNEKIMKIYSILVTWRITQIVRKLRGFHVDCGEINSPCICIVLFSTKLKQKNRYTSCTNRQFRFMDTFCYEGRFFQNSVNWFLTFSKQCLVKNEKTFKFCSYSCGALLPSIQLICMAYLRPWVLVYSYIVFAVYFSLKNESFLIC